MRHMLPLLIGKEHLYYHQKHATRLTLVTSRKKFLERLLTYFRWVLHTLLFSFFLGGNDLLNLQTKHSIP